MRDRDVETETLKFPKRTQPKACGYSVESSTMVS